MNQMAQIAFVLAIFLLIHSPYTIFGTLLLYRGIVRVLEKLGVRLPRILRRGVACILAGAIILLEVLLFFDIIHSPSGDDSFDMFRGVLYW